MQKDHWKFFDEKEEVMTIFVNAYLGPQYILLYFFIAIFKFLVL